MCKLYDKNYRFVPCLLQMGVCLYVTQVSELTLTLLMIFSKTQRSRKMGKHNQRCLSLYTTYNLKPWPWDIKGEYVSFLPSVSLVVNLLAPFKGVYIVQLLLWMTLFSWVPIFVDWANITYSWGSEFMVIILFFIIHTDNHFRGY